MKWLPWIVVALIPGALNALIAYEELAERCRILPFFEPFKTPGVWLWTLIQVSFPAVLFWLALGLTARPAIDAWLLLEAIAFGAGFTAILNASITIRTRTYSIKPIYDRFVQIAYVVIRNSKQGDRALRFWGEVETALSQSANLTEGLQYLEDYFAVEASFALRPEDYTAKLEEVRTAATQAMQAKLIKSLLQKVRREQLYGILRRFQIQEGLFAQYFPHKLSKARLRRPL